MGFFDRLREGLTRTKEQLLGRFDEIVERADAQPEARAATRRVTTHDRFMVHLGNEAQRTPTRLIIGG